MREKRLKGVRIAVLAADGFEQVEVTRPVKALRNEGADVRIISLRAGRIRGMNFLWRGRKVSVDDTVFNARPEDYGALLLPGGFVSPDLLRQNERARAFVREMDQLRRPIATICHGPELLISAGLLGGRRLTSWPGIADDVRNAGGVWEDSPVVRDGHWVASRSPMDLRQFNEAMIELFDAEAVRGLSPLRRRIHWVAQLSRLATVGMAAAAVVGGRAVVRGSSRIRLGRRRSTAGAALEMLRDLGVATALGGLIVGRLTAKSRLRAAAAAGNGGTAFGDGTGRARGGGRPELVNGLGLAATAVGWLARRRRLGRRPGLRTAADILLGGALATGVTNLVTGGLLARRRRRPLAAQGSFAGEADELLGTETEAPPPSERLMRAGDISGLAQAGALAGLICTTAALRAPR